MRERANSRVEGATRARRCPACGAELGDARTAYRIADWRVIRCASCRTGVTVPRPDSDTLRALYDDPRYYEMHGIQHATILPDHRARARVVRSWAPGRRLLEVGTGEGYLLAALREEGFEVRGCEISAFAVEVARKRFGLEVFHGELSEAGYEHGSMDVVLMYHVLEHTAEPEHLLRCVREVLRPGGLAIVEVPNLDSAQMRWGRGRRHILDLPFHLVHFTPDGLTTLLERTGFRVMQLTIPFGPPLAPVFAAYERVRDRLVGPRPAGDVGRGGSATEAQASSAVGSGGSRAWPDRPRWPEPSEAVPGGGGGRRSRQERIASGDWKAALLGLARRLSSAYKMTAYAERLDGR